MKSFSVRVVFPACAGVSGHTMRAVALFSGISRVRGGERMLSNDYGSVFTYFPRARG